MIGGHGQFSRLIERAFVRGLSVRQRRKLHEHLVGCERCRESWERLAAVDRHLGGPSLPIPTIDAICDRVIATRVVRHRAVWAAAAGALALALVVLVVRVRSEDPSLRPRGPGDRVGRTPGVRIFCIARTSDQVVAESRMVSTAPVPTLYCTIDDVLQIAYTTPSLEGLTMIAYARDAQSILYYAPLTEGSTLPVASDRVDELVAWSTRLEVNHHPGSYELVVRFFDGSVSTRDAIESRIPPIAELRGRLEVLPKGAHVDAP